MKKGKVVMFNPEKGFGFILGTDGKSYFAHCSNIVLRIEPRLYVNEYVQFESVKPKTRRRSKNDSAINIQPIDELDDSSPYKILKNPFNPRFPINRPEKFAGRKQSVKEGATALVNMQNILITGDRGIGKSSFANQLLYIAEGENYLLKKMKIDLPDRNKLLSFATISIRTLPDMSLKEIAGLIVRELLVKFDIKNKKKEIEHQIDLKIYKHKIKTVQTEKDFKDILDIFGYDLINILDALQPIDGIIILIDEVENIDPSSKFPNFIKNVSEYLISEERNINFILSGIRCAITDMFLQHPSFFRLFEPIELKELSTIESYELIDIYLANQNKSINAKTKTSICKVARGYPVNLQLLGFYSYQLSPDSNIDENDLRMAIDHIIDNIKKNEFIGKHESIGYGLPETILQLVLMEVQGASVSFQTICQSLKKEKEEDILDALNTLVNCEIFHKYSKGKYFIKDYLLYRFLQKHYGLPRASV